MDKESGSDSKQGGIDNKEDKVHSESESEEGKTKTPKDKITKEKTEVNGNSVQGRWNKQEHERFIDAIKKFGKDWKTVEQYIETRSGSQIRSHAQKFFNRIIKKYAIDKTEVIGFIQNSYQSEDSSESATPQKRKKTDRDTLLMGGDTDPSTTPGIPVFQLKPSQQPKQPKEQSQTAQVGGSVVQHGTNSGKAKEGKGQVQSVRGGGDAQLLSNKDHLEAHRSISGDGSAQSVGEANSSGAKQHQFRR